MRKILINFAHPTISKSRVNRTMLAEIYTLPSEVRSYITINDLYDKYPDFNINVVREKKLLLNHDTILFQHPLHWYSSPAIIQEWQDTVLEQGFAYGEQGDALKGKLTQNIISAADAEESYSSTGFNKFTMTEFLRPFEQIANICQMQYLEPLTLFSSESITADQIKAHAQNYKQHLLHLISGK